MLTSVHKILYQYSTITFKHSNEVLLFVTQLKVRRERIDFKQILIQSEILVVLIRHGLTTKVCAKCKPKKNSQFYKEKKTIASQGI